MADSCQLMPIAVTYRPINATHGLTPNIIAAYTGGLMSSEIITASIRQTRARTTRIRAVGGVCALAG
jgi:hypothetical protein